MNEVLYEYDENQQNVYQIYPIHKRQRQAQIDKLNVLFYRCSYRCPNE